MGSVAGAIAGVVGGIAGEIGFGGSASSDASAAAQASASANILKNKQAKLQAQRQREQDVAKVRGAKASMLTSAAATGAQGSSGFEGSSGALTSELTSNIGYGTQMQKIQDKIVEYENEAILSGNKASEASQTAGFFGNIAELAANFLI